MSCHVMSLFGLLILGKSIQIICDFDNYCFDKVLLFKFTFNYCFYNQHDYQILDYHVQILNLKILFTLKMFLEKRIKQYFTNFRPVVLISNLNPSIVSSPLKLGGLVFEIWTERRVMKKLLRNRGLVERRGNSKLFHQFFFRKACFHYYWNFFVC